MSVCFGCLNVRGLGSNWKQGRFLHDLQSRDVDVFVATETRLRGPRDLLPLLNGYEKYFSPCRETGGGGVLVLLKNDRVSEKKLVFSDLGGRLVVLDLTISGKTFRLVDKEDGVD